MKRSNFLKALVGMVVAPKVLVASELKEPMVEAIKEVPKQIKPIAVYGIIDIPQSEKEMYLSKKGNYKYKKRKK